MGSSNQITATDYAVDLVRRVCRLAGSTGMVSDLQRGVRRAGVLAAIERRDTPVLFNWLMRALSFQGIADRVADGFIREHGNVEWSDVLRNLAQSPGCRK